MNRQVSSRAGQASRRALGRHMCLALAMLSMPLVAQSATFCVGTVTELGNAVQQAALTQGHHEIRLRQGTYTLPQGLLFQNVIGGDLVFSGGWNSNCSSTASDPYLTTIQGGAWDLRSLQTEVRLARLRFSGLPWVRFNDFVGSCTANGQRFRVERSVFDGAHTPHFRLYFASDCHDIEVENVLVLGGEYGIVRFASDDADPPPTMRVLHTTVLGAQTSGIKMDHLEADGYGFVELFNSVVHGSGHADLWLIRTHVLALNNHYATTTIGTGSSFVPGSAGNLSGNPQLQANGRPIEPNSPVINSGSIWVPGGLPTVDITGAPRVFGSAPDRGAFETSIDDLGVITVTSHSDSGPGSLRQAILSANASPGPHVILFNLTGPCPRSIYLLSPLPAITDSGLLLINGGSQPGSSTNTLLHGNSSQICLQLRTFSDSNVSHALRVPNGSNALLWLNAVGIGGFSTAGLELLGGSGHILHGNRFGGTGTLANGIGVRIGDGAANVQFGGTYSPGFRNTILGNDVAGILVAGSSGVEIGNNYIGTDPDGTTMVGNGIGVLIWSGATGTRIHDNVISGNDHQGLLLSGADTAGNVVTGNRIGLKRVNAAGSASLGNGDTGVRINGGAHDNRIGGIGRGAGNLIGNNGNGGIWVQSGRRNRLSRNSMPGNVGMGIDLAEQGINPNDNDSGLLPADYANRGLNFPVLTSAVGGAQSGIVTGTLTTTPGIYVVELFATGGDGSGRQCDPSGHGEGERFVGQASVQIPVLNPGPPQGTVAFAVSIANATGLTGSVITATATDADGNTSEFSACRAYQNDVIFTDGFE